MRIFRNQAGQVAGLRLKNTVYLIRPYDPPGRCRLLFLTFVGLLPMRHLVAFASWNCEKLELRYRWGWWVPKKKRGPNTKLPDPSRLGYEATTDFEFTLDGRVWI